MINTAGAFILVLIYSGNSQGGITTHEMNSFESCKAAITQLETIRNIRGYCIAKDLK